MTRLSTSMGHVTHYSVQSVLAGSLQEQMKEAKGGKRMRLTFFSFSWSMHFHELKTKCVPKRFNPLYWLIRVICSVKQD